MIAALLALLFLAFIIAVVYGLGGLVFAFLWNLLVPSLWHAAPHLTWFQGVAVAWVIGVLRSIFGRAA